MKKIKKLKSELKELATEIRELRKTRKSERDGYVPLLDNMSWNARHMHIAYCMLRGRKYEEIEKYCREEPNMNRVEKIMEEYREDVCISA